MVDIGRREDQLLDKIAELVRKRDDTLKRLVWLDPSLDVFAADLIALLTAPPKGDS